MKAEAHRRGPTASGPGRIAASSSVAPAKTGPVAVLRGLQHVVGNRALRGCIQRKVGFEAEVQVNAFRNPPNPAARSLFDGGKGVCPDSLVNFLTGALPYAGPIGKVSDVEMKADHGPIGSEVRKVLGAIRALSGIVAPDTANYTDKKSAPTLIEYVSPPIDELRPGSDADFKAATDAVVRHVDEIFALKPQDKVSLIPGSPDTWMGWPVAELREWLGTTRYDSVAPVVDATRKNLSRILHVQVTAGIIPSALPGLFESEAARAKAAAAKPYPQRLDYQALTQEINEGVAALFNHSSFEFWLNEELDERPSWEVEALRGLLQLAYSYVVGEAWYQAGAEIGTGKNMVPFLLQMPWKDVRAKAMPANLRTFPPGMVRDIARILGQRPAARKAWWEERKPASPATQESKAVEPAQGTQERKGFMGKLDVVSFIEDILGDKPVSELANGKLEGDAQRYPPGEEKREPVGIPLERRYVQIYPEDPKERHTTGNLHEVVMRFVEEARRLNMRHLPDDAKAKVLDALRKAGSSSDSKDEPSRRPPSEASGIAEAREAKAGVKPAPAIQRALDAGTCGHCQAGHPHGDGQERVSGDFLSGKDGGRPLDGSVRGFMEGRFGRDFGGVRVHTDAHAARSAGQISALAYTAGGDIFFAPGQYRPDTHEGRRLLAHELTHVIQQGGSPPSAQAQLVVGAAHDAFEDEADRAADAVMAPGGTPAASTLSAPRASLQRKVGFEVELNVNVFANPAHTSLAGAFYPPEEEDFDEDARTRCPQGIVNFLTQGLRYDAPIASTPHFHLKADHNDVADPILGVLHALARKHHAPEPETIVDAKNEPSILEYASRPIDELAGHSTADFHATIDAVLSHIQMVFQARPAHRISDLAGAPGFGIGVPVRELKAWLGAGEYAGDVKAAVEAARSAIQDTVAIQVTAGILPSALPDLYAREAKRGAPAKGELSGDRLAYGLLTGEIDAGVNALFADRTLTGDAFFGKLSPTDRAALKGLVALAYSYVVGDAWMQTGVYLGVNKNSVPFLLQMPWDKVRKEAMPAALASIPQSLARTIGKFLAKRPLTQPEDWEDRKLDMKMRRPGTPIPSWVEDGNVEAFFVDVLGDQPKARLWHNELPGDVQPYPVTEASGEAIGAPVEYRHVDTVQARLHKSSDLRRVVMEFVEEARALNTRNLGNEARKTLLAAANGKTPSGKALPVPPAAEAKKP